MQSFDHEHEPQSNLRQRLWGAAVLIAIMVIVLPLILDGAGSESQFRRVERLREAPASGTANPDVQMAGESTGQIEQARSTVTGQVMGMRSVGATVDIKIGEDDPPDYMKAEKEVRETLEQNRAVAPLTAWVVEAGSFTEESDALAVRDNLRRGGFASFVRDREAASESFRVLVGPMISEQSANSARAQVQQLLGSDAIVQTYP